MPTVRTTCPTCDTVIIDASSLTLRRRPEAAHAECCFTCPQCGDEVVQPLSDRMVPVLIGAGCQVADWNVEDARAVHPSMSGAITETEIAEFIADLDREDCLDELVHH